MAKSDYTAYALVIPENESLNREAYFSALREANLSPTRWLAAKHSGAVTVQRDPVSGEVVFSRPAPESEE